MSDSDSAISTSWTILTPETLRPVAEGAEPHEDPLSGPSTAEPAGGAGESGAGASPVVAEEGQSVESQQAPQEIEPERNEETIPHMEDTSDPTPAHDLSLTPGPIPLSNTPPPSSLEVLSPEPTHDLSLTPDPDPTAVGEVPAPSSPDPDTLSQSAGLSESPAPPSPDPDSFSDSYTHISPSVEEVPRSLLSTETLGAEGLTPEEEGLIQEGEAIHQLSGEGHGLEEEESELPQRVTELGKQADFPLDAEVGEERAEERGEEGESGLRRRRASLLAALEQIGRSDEEEVEEFQPPQKEEERGLSINKCILGAVILLGLGTIFFSGVFMDLDEEGEYDIRELRDEDVAGKEEWLNPETPPEIPPIDVDNTDPLNKLSLENEQITVLQAQLQAQKEELKVAQGQAAEGAKERLRREEVEKENGRLKKEMASLPVLQKENERMKRELESVPALQREVERLRATVTELNHPTAGEVSPPPDSATALPPSGLVEESSQKTDGTIEQAKKPLEGEKMKDWTGGKEWKKGSSEQGEQGQGWKEKGEKKEWKEGGKREKAEKEWKKEKLDQEKESTGWKRQKEEKKEWKGKEEKRGELKKEKASRGDEGKPWKDREEKKERKEKSERKEWKEKKDTRDKWNEGKEWRGKSDRKEKKGGDEYGGKKDGWREENEWRKSKDGFKDSGKGWKEREGKKEGNGGKDFKKKDGRKYRAKEWQEDRKPWQGKDKEWSKDGERKGWKEERKDGDWKKDKWGHHKSKDGHKQDRQEKSDRQHYEHREKGKKERVWQGPGGKSPPHSHRRPPMGQPDYWTRQRERLQHNPSPSAQCASVETCAQAEGLLPVPLPEFEALLLSYLAKTEGVGVEASKREELSKLAKEFFRDGVFAHDQMSFRDFVEDVGDILEDMVEREEEDGDDDDEEEEQDQGLEEEMDGFDEEAMKKFALPGGGEKEQRKKGEWKKERGRSRG